MKCYPCKLPLRKHWKYCPYCGKLARITSTKKYAMILGDSLQANRIEEMLKKLISPKKDKKELS